MKSLNDLKRIQDRFLATPGGQLFEVTRDAKVLDLSETSVEVQALLEIEIAYWSTAEDKFTRIAAQKKK